MRLPTSDLRLQRWELTIGLRKDESADLGRLGVRYLSNYYLDCSHASEV